MILDASDLIVGRFATVVAKKALLGDKIDIVNCEKAIITGSKKQILARFHRMRNMGIPLQGPYYPRMADRIVRRIVRGMLPYKRPKGADAFKRVMCHIGSEGFKDAETIDEANVKKLPNIKYMTVGDICKELK